MRVPVALFNFENGGMLVNGGYDFRPMQDAFAEVDEPPALVLLCEAKHYTERGQVGLNLAACALSEKLDRAYVGKPGWTSRGPFGPAIFYAPAVLALEEWWDGVTGQQPDDKVNMALFRVRETRQPFRAIVDHWHPRSGVQRKEEAERVDRWGSDRLPALFGGDLNSTASGPHLPNPDWERMPYRARSHKGRRLPDGSWGPDTDAVDHLIGQWDGVARKRVDGCGFQAVAELAVEHGTDPEAAFLPTTNNLDGGLLIDWLLVNGEMASRYAAGTYRVHVPPGPVFPSDHRLVTATFDL